MRDIAPLLASAIPLGIYNFAEGMTNVESAAAAGDHYRVRQVLAADGLGAIVGSFLGSPFPPAVYIGHPGWKAVGGRIGYSLVTGIVVAIVCVTGLVGTFLAIFPMQALGPVLLYIGLVIGSQANTASAKRYAPAIVLALLPSLAQWATGQIDNALAAAGTTAADGRDGTADRVRGDLRRPAASRAGRGAGRHPSRRDRLFVIDRRLYRRRHRGDRRRARVRRARQRGVGGVERGAAATIGYSCWPRSSPVRLCRARGRGTASSTTGCCSSTAP